MASNTSAVLDVVTENKDLSSILKDIERPNSIETSISSQASLETFSTLPDIDNLSELNIDENSDMCVRIDKPQRHLETLETFITFRITTKVARIEYENNEYVVRRRYNDFVWLRQKLSDSHPFCIIPPLPGKHTLIGQLDRYSKEFILMRMKALNIFIKRVAQHPILSCNEYFKVFLTSKYSDFNLFRRQRTNPETRIHGLSHPYSTHTALKNRHLEFDKTKTYLNILSDKLSSIEKVSSRISKERSEIVHELNNFYPIFISWSNSELNLNKLLLGIGKAMKQTANTENMLVQTYNNVLTTPVKDFLNYIDVVQDILRKRELCQHAFEHSMDELNRKNSEKDKLLELVKKNPSINNQSSFSFWNKHTNCDEKLGKLSIQIPQLLKKVEANQDHLECANESLRSDLERWQNEKHDWLKTILLDFVNKQIDYYKTGLQAWEAVLNDIQQPSLNTTTASSSN